MEELSNGISNEQEERTREIEELFRDETRNRCYARGSRKPNLDDYDGNGE